MPANVKGSHASFLCPVAIVANLERITHGHGPIGKLAYMTEKKLLSNCKTRFCRGQLIPVLAQSDDLALTLVQTEV